MKNKKILVTGGSGFIGSHLVERLILKNIEGEDISEINWNFSKSSNTFASWGQKLVYWGPLKPLEKIILNTPLVFLGILASNIFHNFYWLRFKGRKRINSALNTEWGDLFKKY